MSALCGLRSEKRLISFNSEMRPLKASSVLLYSVPGITQMSFALQTLMNVRVETPAVTSSASTIQEATNAAVRKAFRSVPMAVDVMVKSCSLTELQMRCATGGWSLEAVPLWSSVWSSGLRHVTAFVLWWLII